MTSVRDIMSGGAECADANETLHVTAMKMRDLDVGALPICGADHRLQGVITDRDIVIRCVADGGDPTTTMVAKYAGDKPVTIGADDSVEDALRTMKDASLRRLPVIDRDQLVGMLTQADIAAHLPKDATGDLVAAVSSATSGA